MKVATAKDLPSPRYPWIKVCGLHSFGDIEACAAAGATHAGFNTWPRSPRHAEPGRLGALIEAARRVGLVPVFVSFPGSMASERGAEGQGAWLQCAVPLHPEVRRGFLGTVEARPARSGSISALPWGDVLLLDAHAEELPGGTGRTVPPDLALSAPRPFVLAGGLNPDNVARAIARFSPTGVDAASGLESSPGVKDAGRIRAFCAAAREAFRSLQERASAP